ncbi:MAG: CHASE2 domain-containing protein [Cyanomargarita calcarea GSE-NOS-MK-12-04C]|jgi:CHASE2 domain-containing sensor protein|uniref:CHASE2 domain-containing protein n=1 Tax=Cyanomargarita calcarea GSE-NOS-MK-12-04C TaxID=2839659 RepID=A0A951QRT3_9CYAN|nr:CHASE2 domain-containing protein [Cyanomargarita calcarea GSE-NOS-MK-12-04C]
MTNLKLKIQRIEQVSLFELSWGKGQQLSVTVSYPENITTLYKEWQRAYLSYYKTAIRGRVVNIGTIAPATIDWHAKLVQSEAKLLSEFHKWLRSGELYEIRSVIAHSSQSTVNIFLTCNSLELERLPWEVWEIGREFASEKIRIVRTPKNIHNPIKNQNHRRSSKIRLLAILGDDTGLNFQVEKEAIYQLSTIADVVFIGWEPGKNIPELKNEIKDAISSEKGWDILFFAGHSNETTLTGGEIAIAPNVALSINELLQPLTTALKRGLQFAIFNSCNGLSIANTLIDMGLSQVAVMREPIHNSVASEFLLQFLQTLTEYKDVHEALQTASQYLKLEKNLTYPSAYLIPSLFRHPESELFRPKPFGIRQRLKKLIPTRNEAIVVSSLLLISLQLPVQSFLLEQRLVTQAKFRQLTGQIAVVETPPVLLVQIDDKSIQKADINPIPMMDREYLASIIDKLVANRAKVIGIDYLLDRYQAEKDKILAKSIQNGVNSINPTWFVFATTRSATGDWIKARPEITKNNWSLHGEIEVLPGYMQLLPLNYDNSQPLYLANLLALSHQLNNLSSQKRGFSVKQPQLNSQTDFWQELNKQNFNQERIFTSPRNHLQPLTQLSYRFHQMWLHPILDFSIPPNQIYQRLPAWKLLDKNSNNSSLSHLQQQIVIIAPGGNNEAGMNAKGEDNFEVPPAVKYWRQQENPDNQNKVFIGGEFHAYMVHHLLTNRLVVPIPDVWMIVVAIFIGKYLSDIIQKNSHLRWRILVALGTSTTIYGLVSLQIYLSSIALLFPWFLPSLIVWLYVTPALLRKKAYE